LEAPLKLGFLKIRYSRIFKKKKNKNKNKKTSVSSTLTVYETCKQIQAG